LDGSTPDKLWQTRDFNCELNVYDISADGQLLKLQGRHPHDRHLFDSHPSKEWESCTYTGEIELLGDTGTVLHMTFVHGKLTDVRSGYE
jgi:hypothetical protein